MNIIMIRICHRPLFILELFQAIDIAKRLVLVQQGVSAKSQKTVAVNLICAKLEYALNREI